MRFEQKEAKVAKERQAARILFASIRFVENHVFAFLCFLCVLLFNNEFLHLKSVEPPRRNFAPH
jgi:hypothetical protein